MKEEKLGEPAKRAELFLRPLLEMGEAKGFSLFWEVELAEEAIDPDIDGKGVGPTVRIKENAPGDFWADAGKRLEMSCGLGGRKGMREEK